MEKNKTPIQELISTLTSNGLISINQTIIDTCLELEKHHMIRFAIKCQLANLYSTGPYDAESVYNEFYNHEH